MIHKNNQFFNTDRILSIAFETGFIKRSNYKIDPCLLLTSFIIVLAKGSYLLREWALKYRTFSETIISLQAIHKKLSIRCLSFLEGLVQYVLSNAIFHNTKYNQAILDKFNRVIIEDSTCIKLLATERLENTIEEATLIVPQNIYPQKGGNTGLHTEHLGFIISDLQYLQRAYPGAEW